MAKNIERVEIFSTGKHRGSEAVTITETDLDEMVNSFNALGSEAGFRPVLKLGHEDAQKFFGQRKGAPNLGFVEKIWKEGGKVLANFSNVPNALVDLIGQRRYNSVSIEMFPKTEVGGKTFSNVLTAVALLGAELPAVKGLSELAATLFTEEDPDGPEFSGELLELTTSEEVNMATYSQEQTDALVNAAVAEATKTVKAEFEAEVAELKDKVTASDAAKETAITTLREYEDKARTTEAETLVEDAIKAGKLLPAQKDEALAFALTLDGTIKFGDKEKSASDVFKTFIEGMPVKVDFDEHSAGDENSDKLPADPGDEVIDRANKLIEANAELSFSDARQKVLADNPTLKQRYFEMGE